MQWTKCAFSNHTDGFYSILEDSEGSKVDIGSDIEYHDKYDLYPFDVMGT